ncbi:MAG: hypothetical protein ACREOF_01450 [Gemmatimonadales bacterium]
MRLASLTRWAALGLAAAVVVAAVRRRWTPRGAGEPPDPHLDRQLDEALKETFPASDSIAVGRIE